MNYFLDNQFSHDYFDLILSIQNNDYYIKMMKAWYFATALAKQYDSALKILQSNRLDQWTHNKTIQKAIESYRISEEKKEVLRELKIRDLKRW